MPAKYLLREFKIYEVKIKDLEIEIEILKEEDGLRAIEYKESTGYSGKIISSIEETIIRSSNRIEKLEKQKLILEKKQNRIINILNILNDDERRIVKLRHLEDFNYTWDIIAERLNLSYGVARGIYNRALRKIDSVMQ